MKLKYSNFLTKLLSVAIVFFVFACYQNVAVKNERIEAENAAAVAEVEEENAKIQAEMEPEAETEGGWIDGVYEGSGAGFGGDVVVSVTISGGKIASIEVTDSSTEDPAYFSQAVVLVDEMVKAQGTDVDTVSGATFSSGGLISAVDDALGKAVS